MAERVRSLLFGLKATLNRLGDPKQQQHEGGVGSGEHALKGDVLTLVQQLLKVAGRALQDRGEMCVCVCVWRVYVCVWRVCVSEEWATANGYCPAPHRPSLDARMCSTHTTQDVPRDEKLLCASLLLRSDEPPDLLRFLAWGAGVPGGSAQLAGMDAVKKAKQLTLQHLYALVKVRRCEVCVMKRRGPCQP